MSCERPMLQAEAVPAPEISGRSEALRLGLGRALACWAWPAATSRRKRTAFRSGLFAKAKATTCSTDSGVAADAGLASAATSGASFGAAGRGRGA